MPPAIKMLFSGGSKKKVYPVIKGMATGNPRYRCPQRQALAVAMKVPGLDNVRPVLERIYTNSRIGSRYFAVPDFTPDQADKDDELFFPADGSFQVRARWSHTISKRRY